VAFRIYPRGRIYWVYVYFPGSGRRGFRKTTGCTDPRAADAVARRIELAATAPSSLPADETTLSEALERFLESKHSKAEGTKNMYGVKAGQLLRVIGADTALQIVDARTVDSFIKTRRGEGASDNTIGKELTTLRGALKVAKRRNEYPLDIEQTMPVDWSNGYKPRRTYLTEAQAQQLLRALPPRRAAHVAFILATSARDSEVSRAERRDIDMARGYVKLHGTKTEGSDREVPITPIAKPLLQLVLRSARKGDGKLFEPWLNQRRDLAVYCTKLRIGREVEGVNGVRWVVTANDLRRSCATWLVQRGVAPYLVGKVLGHKSSRMVERVYGVMTSDALGRLIGQSLKKPTAKQGRR